MMIRPVKLEDSTNIVELLYGAYGKSRYGKKFIPHWVNCFVTSPLIFPSFVAIDESGCILGYIVWRIRQVSDDQQLTIELQELTASNGSNKLQTEQMLFDESPSQIVTRVTELGFDVGNHCNLYIWVHEHDAQNSKSVFYKPQQEFGIFIGAYERSDARGGILRLYRQLRKF